MGVGVEYAVYAWQVFAQGLLAQVGAGVDKPALAVDA